jgi:hypothetical protein
VTPMPTPSRVPVIDARDEAWLLARERGQAASPPSPETERAYQRLERALAQLPLVDPREAGHDDGWQEHVLAGLPADAGVVPITSARRHRAVRWALATAPALAAAAAVAIFVWPTRGAELDVAIERGAAAVRSADGARVGDVLRVTGRVGAGELRIYRGERALVLRCPGDSACVASGSGADRAWTVEVRLPAPGRYHVVRFIGAGAGEPTGLLDGDMAAAMQAGAKVVAAPQPVDVQ